MISVPASTIVVREQWAGQYIDLDEDGHKVWAAAWGYDERDQEIYMAAWRRTLLGRWQGQWIDAEYAGAAHARFEEKVREKKGKGYERIPFQSLGRGHEYISPFQNPEMLSIAAGGFNAWGKEMGAAPEGRIVFDDRDPIEESVELTATLREGRVTVIRVGHRYQRLKLRLEVIAEFGGDGSQRQEAMARLKVMRAAYKEFLVA